MSDLVKRLRDAECPAGCGSMKFCVCAYAADAGDYIEKLEAQPAAADALAEIMDEEKEYIDYSEIPMDLCIRADNALIAYREARK